MNYHINRWILLMVITTAVIITTTGLVGAITVDGSKSLGEWDESWAVSTDPLDIITSGIPSGMDIEKLYAHYDSATDTLYLMLKVYGIPGDLDGNGDIGSSCINGDCLGDPGPAGTGIGPQEFIYVFISPIFLDPYFVISCNNNIITTVSSDETFPFSGAIKFAYESQSDSVYEISIEGISDYFGNPIFDENLDGTWDKALRITVNSGGSIDTNPDDNINAIIYNIDSPSSSFTVGQGASPAIKQLFIDAYNRNGGVGVLGEPESDVHEAFGLYPVQNFPGVPDIHGGVLMYNSIQNNVSYIHGAIWERYYIFQDKAELGPVKEDEKDAAPSQQGTTGRYSKFETGTIHWISNKTGENENNPVRGESFVTYGDLDKLYTDMGGAYKYWLGFPTMDQEVMDGHGRCDFEGGGIYWNNLYWRYNIVVYKLISEGDLRIYVPPDTENWPMTGTKVMPDDVDVGLGSMNFIPASNMRIMFLEQSDINGKFDAEDTIYIQTISNSNYIHSGDIRLTGYHDYYCPSSIVFPYDDDNTLQLVELPGEQEIIGYVDVNLDGDCDILDPIYVDTDDSSTVSINDLRLSEIFAIGSYTLVTSGDPDIGNDLLDIVTSSTLITTPIGNLLRILDRDYSGTFSTPDMLYIITLNAEPTTPPAIQDKTLLQVDGQPEVYWLQNNKLYWVTDWDVINQMLGIPGWDDVNILQASEFDPAAYEQGPVLITTGPDSDGLLIKEVGDYKVYLIENGKKRHITYPDVMDLKDYSFDDVIEVSSEILNMFQVGEPIGIEVDLYFNKSIDSVETSHESQFTTDETVKLITETTVAEDYSVETYVKMINPDGTEKYAYYENVDFLITDLLQFSDVEIPLYPGTWHAQTQTWNWDEYTFAGDEVEGVYTWEFWYKDTVTGKVLGKDVQGYEFSKSPPSPVDIIPPFISIINHLDGTTIFKDDNILVYGIAFDPSGIETLTINNENVISYQVFGVFPFFTFVNLNEGLNEVTISARDSSENYNEITERISINYYPFDVKINSPNDMDRYTPEESMNIYAEVTGGTPSFTYKWIIDELNSIGEIQNHVEYPGSSPDGSIELPVLESSIYEIQLEVTDSKGYSIVTEEKQIIISPLNVGSTFGFRPNPNGYNFSNFARDDYSWEMFYNTYGADQVELSDGIPNPIAEDFYNSINFTHAGKYGTCFGMSASSLVTYQEDDGTNNYRSWDLGDDRTNPLPSWPFFPSFVSTTQDWIEYYQPLYHSEAAISDRVIYDNPITVYDELKLRMASVWIDDPMVIGMEWHVDGKLVGHAVVPYKIEEAIDHRSGKVFIYDSNRSIPPGEEGHFISFNLESKTAKNEEYNGGNDLANVKAIKLSSVQNEKTPLRIPNLESVTSDGDLLYEDSVARHYGFYDGVFEEEIPGVTQIINWNHDEYNQFLETYYISDINLKRELYGVDDGIATVSISRANSFVIADVQVSPNSVDEINVPADGSSVEFISGEGTSTLSLMLDKQNTEFARIVRITGSEIESENGVQISFSDDLFKVRIINKGLTHGYDLYLKQIGSNPSSYNSLRQIIVEENSAVWITPLDWNDIDDNAILIEYDSGNDGTIESSEMINTYNITFLPPITTMDQFNLKDGSTFPIKFTASNSTTDEFIYDDTVNVTITNSTGHLITYFTNGTGTDSVRINTEEEQYIVNFHSKNYDLNVGETYTITVNFGELDSLRGYDMTYFRLVE